MSKAGFPYYIIEDKNNDTIHEYFIISPISQNGNEAKKLKDLAISLAHKCLQDSIIYTKIKGQDVVGYLHFIRPTAEHRTGSTLKLGKFSSLDELIDKGLKAMNKIAKSKPNRMCRGFSFSELTKKYYLK
ncbi:MAG: hypothetical protein ACRCS8_00375 [Brevinema sp.]